MLLVYNSVKASKGTQDSISVPDSFRSSDTINSFRRHLKTQHFQPAFYDNLYSPAAGSNAISTVKNSKQI